MASFEAFYETANYNGQCERLRLYRTCGANTTFEAQTDPADNDGDDGADPIAATSSTSVPVHKGKRKLSGKDAYALTLFLLRTGSSKRMAASLFGVSSSTVTRYFTSWICFLNQFLDDAFP